MSIQMDAYKNALQEEFLNDLETLRECQYGDTSVTRARVRRYLDYLDGERMLTSDGYLCRTPSLGWD